MSYKAINFQQKFGLFAEKWSPKVVAEMNDYQFKIVKLEGDFVWHDHKDTDETFIVVEGNLRIELSRRRRQRRGRRDVRGSQGRRAQAVCRERSEAIAHRAARSVEYRPRGWRADRRE